MSQLPHNQVNCDDCGARMAATSLHRHKKTFHGSGVETRYICDFPCLKVFRRKDKLKEHQKKVGPRGCQRGKTPNLCHLCGKHITGSVSVHNRQSRCSQKFSCPECNNAFFRKEDFLKHMVDDHAIEVEFV